MAEDFMTQREQEIAAGRRLTEARLKGKPGAKEFLTNVDKSIQEDEERRDRVLSETGHGARNLQPIVGSGVGAGPLDSASGALKEAAPVYDKAVMNPETGRMENIQEAPPGAAIAPTEMLQQHAEDLDGGPHPAPMVAATVIAGSPVTTGTTAEDAGLAVADEVVQPEDKSGGAPVPAGVKPKSKGKAVSTDDPPAP